MLRFPNMRFIIVSSTAKKRQAPVCLRGYSSRLEVRTLQLEKYTRGNECI